MVRTCIATAGQSVLLATAEKLVMIKGDTAITLHASTHVPQEHPCGASKAASQSLW